jgi:hypothetical protein
MELPTFKIERGAKDNPRRKARVFSTRLLGFLAADSLWEPPRLAEAVRPVWIAYLGTEREAHPFTANLRAGAKATVNGQVVQLPKRAPYRWSTQKVLGGVATVTYLPELFHLEPALPFADDVRFVLAPPRWWVEEQAAALAPEHGDDVAETARAALFCAFLDRRTPLPLVHDLRFHLQVYRAALETDWVHPASSSRYPRGVLYGQGTEAAGLDAPLACRVDQETLAQFLVEQTTLYHREESRRAELHRPVSLRRPRLPAQAGQLRLGFG